MNGFTFRQIIRRFAQLSRPRQAAMAAGLAALVLIAISVAWLAGGLRRSPGGQPRALQTTLADSPSWQRDRPAWPKYLPELSEAGSSLPASATVTPAVIHGPAEVVDEPLTIAAGPELFLPAAESIAVEAKKPQPSAPSAPPQVVAVQPPVPVPAPASAVVPAPARLPENPPDRSEAMEKIATQSDQQIRHGFELASHGAYFAARAEFTAALRLIAQGLDNQVNTTAHTDALSAALTAIHEAQDFIPAGGKLEGDLDLPPIIASHRTPVLKNVPPQSLQAMRALKQYLTFAQQQFAFAAGQEVSGSVALGALGKMHAALAGKAGSGVVAPEAKAIVFFQAAILVCPRNYMAANDLGVLLAHSGDYAGGRRMLEHSVLVCRCSENLNNLSVVYRHLGEPRLADLAVEKAQAAKAEESTRQKSANLSAGGTVAWVDPAALVQSANAWTDGPAKSATSAGQQDLAPGRRGVGKARWPGAGALWLRNHAMKS